MRFKTFFWLVLGLFLSTSCSSISYLSSNSDAIFKYNRATGEISVYWKVEVEHIIIPKDTVRVKNQSQCVSDSVR